MCGIAGMLLADPRATPDPAKLARLRDRLRHRGPDDAGIAVEGPCGLVHTRLSILDLSARGHQPMSSPDGRLSMVFNGEIYGYRALREELRRAGHRFVSETDSEVILHLFEQGGAAALTRLEGMFAFALFDRARGELLLMRDRTGIKPLFWRHDESGIAFASEPKALDRTAGAPPAARVAEQLAFRHLVGDEAFCSGVETLAPGHWLRSDGRRVQLARWWAPAPRDGARAEDTARTIDDAVARQLVSDVPVGVFLSGGNDSALVTAAAAARLPSVDTFTVGFDDPAFDETSRARIVSDALRTRAHGLRLDESEWTQGLPVATWHLDAPLNHAHSVHLLALSRFARGHVTVALTGEGSDELFAGYPRYRLHVLARRLRFVPRGAGGWLADVVRGRAPRVGRLLDEATADAAGAAALNAAFVPLAEAAACAGLDDPARALAPRRERVERAMARGAVGLEALLDLERESYLVSLLQRMDRMSMAVGLECRVPLLDERVLELALGLPLSARIDAHDTKKPIRAAAEARFGRAYAHAPKSGFGVPVSRWLREDGPFAKAASALLESARLRERGWLDAARVARRLTEHRRGEADHGELLWGALCLELYARVCRDGDDPARALAR